MIRVWLIDDEPLAITRLRRMLGAFSDVDIVGDATDPEEALAAWTERPADAVFLDIEMPGLTGFDLLRLLKPTPAVVFTTAYRQYAIPAFEADGVDYLLKPVEDAALARAVDRLRRRTASVSLDGVVDRLAAVLGKEAKRWPARIASRVGDRIRFVDLAQITHFYADGKLTWAAGPGKPFIVDESIVQLEARLDPAQFQRIHRTFLVNVSAVRELLAGFGGRMVARLNDERGTELPVARDHVKALRELLGG